MKRKWIRYTISAIIACVVIWIVALAIAFFYIRVNKEAIIASVRSNIANRISGKINFDDLAIDLFENFPGISITVKNVHVRDSLFNSQKKELLSVNEIYMGFGILDLLSGKKTPKYLTLANGTIVFFADSARNKNWNILKEQPESQPKSIALKKIKFININAFFQDNAKRKFYNVWFEKMKCSIDDSRDQIKFKLDNKAIINTAYFNTLKGSYLTNKKMVCEWKIFYDRVSKKLSLRNAIVKLNRKTYQVSGNFFLGDDPHFDLNIKTATLSLKEAASIFPQPVATKINKFQLSKPLRKVEAILSGPMKYLSYPLAKVSFSVADATLRISPTDFQHCSFSGYLKNEIDPLKPRDDFNSYLQFTNVKGEWEKNSFDCKNITFYNLVRPYLRCDIHTIFDLSGLGKAIASRRLDFNSGGGEATLIYAGPLETRTDTVYDLNGIVTVRNGDITYNPRNLNFKKTDIELHFEKGDMLVKQMNTIVNDNKIRINGRVNDFLTFFNTDPSKAAFDWNIYSPFIDISKLRSSLRRNSSVKKKWQGYSFFEQLNNKIDRLFDACNAYLDVRADKVVYKNFSAEKVNGHVVLTNDMIKLDNFSLLHAGGSISFNASSKDIGNNSSLALNSTMQNVDVKELFASFNNFGMASLTSKNISGIFSANISLTSMLDANGDLYKPANKGFIDFSLKNGRLENFKPLMEIDNNFLQKRDLTDVRFAELKDRLDLDGNDIRVNRMEIRSTAVNMYVEGTYSFADNTDLSIQIPLKGQKKDQDTVPENKGLKAKTGMSVFLRAKDDKNGKFKIVYDMLGRFRKKDRN
jgi:hypothetical protein